MKKIISAFVIGSFLVACQNPKSEPDVCMVSQASTFLPEKLPHLNLNPDYLNFEDRFQPDSNDPMTELTRFEALKSTGDVEVKFHVIRQEAGSYVAYACTKVIAVNGFNDFVQAMNTAEICKSPQVTANENQCVQAATSDYLPEVLQARENGEIHSIALSIYSYNVEKYFCDRTAVTGFQNLIKSMYTNLDLQNDCQKK